jgi:hypothetical protein
MNIALYKKHFTNPSFMPIAIGRCGYSHGRKHHLSTTDLNGTTCKLCLRRIVKLYMNVDRTMANKAAEILIVMQVKKTLGEVGI